MAPSRPSEYEKSLALLEAALGSFDRRKPLGKLMQRVPDFGAFEWMLTIIGLEIDLRVDIPESLADALDSTADDFAKRVSSLPKIDSPSYTLECLGLLAQALLSLDVGSEPEKTRARVRATHKAPARGARTPRKKAAQAKRAARALEAKPKPGAASKAKAKPKAGAASKAKAKPKPGAAPKRAKKK